MRTPRIISPDSATERVAAPELAARQRRSYPHLQSLRAIAASLVVVDHSLDHAASRGAVSEDWRQLGYFLGWIGVAVFFATSGFIMYVTSHRGFGSAAAARSFLARRIIRVVPMYWLATACAAALVLPRLDLADLARSLLFIPYAGPGDTVMRPVLGVGWTLNYEMFFYLLFAVALLLPRRVGGPAVFGALTALTVIGRFRSPGGYADPVSLTGFYTDPLLLLFGLGVVAGWLAVRFDLRWQLPLHPVAPTVLALIGATVVFAAAGTRFPLAYWWQALFGVLAAAVVVLCTVVADCAPGRADRVARMVGDASYSTYLFHHTFVTVAAKVWWALPIPQAHPVAMLIFVGVAVAGANLAGWLIYRAVEQRLVAFARRVAGQAIRGS